MDCVYEKKFKKFRRFVWLDYLTDRTEATSDTCAGF